MSSSYSPVPEFDRHYAPGMSPHYRWFREYVNRHFNWSFRTFGTAPNTESICTHIQKEVEEVRKNPNDLEEWIDIIILGLDGALRCQGMGKLVADDLVDALEAKLQKNIQRKWIIPTDPTQPIEHDRTED